MIRVETGDWLKNAGIIGFMQIISEDIFNDDVFDETLDKDLTYIEFDESLLDNFEEKYFSYMINKHKNQLSVSKIINFEKVIKDFLNRELEYEDIERINKILDYTKTKLLSNSYRNGYLLLKDNFDVTEYANQLGKVKVSKKEEVGIQEKTKLDLREKLRIVLEIIEFLKREDNFRILAAKNVMYDIIQPFWTNASFLLKTNNKKNMYELYKGDFIDPVVNYSKSNKEKYKFNCFICDNPISKLSKPNSFDLTWLTKTGVDMSKKSSHFWNLVADAYICPICNLIYSCVPAGFKVINGKGIFINKDASIKILKNINIAQSNIDNETFEEIEGESYFNIVNLVEQENVEKAKYELDNIQVIKFDSSNVVRPYTFNMLNRKSLVTLYVNRKLFKALYKTKIKITDKYYLNVYQEVIKKILNSECLFGLIENLMRLYLNGKLKSITVVSIVLNINNFIIGGERMKKEKREKFRVYGSTLRAKYAIVKADNKLNGISYRMLNALKTDNQSKFMESLINAYMYIKLPVPKDLIDLLGYSNEFKNIGYSFLVGLQGNIEEKEKGENNNEK